jgi:NAD(P)-dependent dehydrogenase (short-subunit alcohol dehydrogenase family)
VAPGFVDTEMLADVPKEVLKTILSGIPVGRLGQPAEIARAVEYLLDKESGYVTGSVVAVNGGLDM